jgi:hydroxymethylbilane synthase
VARLRVATRGSRLARWQAERIVALLGVDAELVVVDTRGDRSPDVELHHIGGQGVFVKEVQAAVLEGDADVAVHSAKDLPALTPDGLVIGAFPERADPRDALVGRALDDVPTGGVVATGSVRRRAFLAYVRPDLSFAPLRGNIETRLRKAEGFDAIIVAYAALQRLGLSEHVAEVLEPALLLPQVAQGALAVECRADDGATRDQLAAIDRADVRSAVTAERSFLATLGGGCDLPCAAYAVGAGPETVLDAALATLDGHVLLRTRHRGTDPEAVGRAAAVQLLDEEGGRALLELEDLDAADAR